VYYAFGLHRMAAATGAAAPGRAGAR
jgi:hypothetical protein